MDRRKILMIMVLLLTLAAIPWGIDIAQAGPGGGTYYANSQAGFRTAETGTFYTGTPLRKFVDSLPGLGAANSNNLGQYIPVAVPDTTTFPGSDYYVIGLKDYRVHMHSDLPATADSLGTGTKLRGYYQINGTDHSSQYLGPLIIAAMNRPVRLRFENHLGVGPAGNLFIPVDTTLMGAGMGPLTALGASCDPSLPNATCAMYTQNRAILHLHGGVTPWISDGTPQQWTTPIGENTTPYLKGVSAVDVPDMPASGQGAYTHYYTNQQSGRLMFYHDHSQGITRLNVYVGEAAGYLLHDPQEDALINAGILPNQGTPAGVYRYGIPLVIQDKTFVSQDIAIQDSKWDMTKWGQPGDLWYPHVYEPNQDPTPGAGGVNPFGRWDYGPWFWPPVTVASDKSTLPDPSSVPEAFMDTPLVNGTAYPFLSVQPQAYRFRILNASNDRALNLQLYYVDPANPTEVKMVPALSHTATSTTPRCATATTMMDAGLAVGAIDTSTGRPLNGTGLPANCWPTTWPTDGRAGGVPDPLTAGPAIIQIGTEGGLLPAPVVIPSTPVGYDYNRRSIVVLNVLNKGLFLQPAERADIIIDFSQVPAGSKLILYNDAPAPVPGFDTRYDYYTDDPDQTASGGAPSTVAGYGPNMRTIMQFQVVGTPSAPFNLTALQNPATGLPNAFKLSQPAPIVPEAAYGPTYGTAYTDTYSKIQDYSLTFSPSNISVGQALRGVTVVTGGAGYNSAPIVSFIGGGCTGAPAATASISGGAVNYVTLTNPGSGCTSAPVVTLTGGGFTTIAVATANFELITLPMQAKAIQELWDPYGRMNATLGVELPFTNNNIQTTIPLGYVDPVTERVPNGQIQLFKITHNGVDTHPVHFHLYNVQLINRVGWDGQIRVPDANELGWKETLRMSPLEDVIVALQPLIPTGLPFAVPHSMRSEDVTMPPTSNISVISPLDGNAVTVSNALQDFGWEYVWHCHILGHEENDFMRTFSVMVPTAVPAAPVNVSAGVVPPIAPATTGNKVKISWDAASTGDPATYFRVMRDAAAITTVYPGAPEGISSIAVLTNGGSGCTSATVAISAPSTGSTQATATATVAGGVVTAVAVTNPGSGYLTVPTVTFTGVGCTTNPTAAANFGYTFTDTWVNSGATYNYSVIAVNSLGNSTAAAAPAVTMPIWVTATGVNIAVSPAPIATPVPPHYLSGTAVTFTATGTGSTLAYEYRFWLTDNATTTKSLVQDYSATSSWVLPASTPPGNYTITVDVRTTSTSQTPDASQTASIIVRSAYPLRTKIGVFSNGSWYFDMNENGIWDPGIDLSFPNFGVGLAGAWPVVGDWTGTGITRCGVFTSGVWYLDMNNNGVWEGPSVDKVIPNFGVGLPNAMPVAGDWGGTGVTKIGVFSNGTWYLDVNGNGAWDGPSVDKVIPNFGVGLPNAIPVVGNWPGSAGPGDKIGVFSNGTWYLDKSGNGIWDGPSTDIMVSNFGVGLPNAIPVVGDWDNTGVTRIGVFSNGTWYLDIIGNGVWDGGIVDKVISNFGVGLPNAIPVVVRY